jgi:predicted metalloprotease with PDZ domain
MQSPKEHTAILSKPAPKRDSLCALCGLSLRSLRLKAFDHIVREEDAQRTQRKACLPIVFSFLILLCLSGAQGFQSPTVHYRLSLANPAFHRVHVRLQIPPGSPQHELQLPVWNALYQVRDFSQYVNWVQASDSHGTPIPIEAVDKSRWRISGAENGAGIDYDIVADQPGPYGAQLNAQHAFFNLAEILMYALDLRSSPIELALSDIPAGWKTATAMAVTDLHTLSAENYDRLVDSPVEIGTFRESDFDDNDGHYRIVVDADPADYDLQKITGIVRRIVGAETNWMNDRPFSTYLFIYHFPRTGGGGGMEHAYSTAIDVNARVLADNALALPEVTAHEFFHLWNVKRIRPQSLEPVDYTKENYTRSLWFSEGVTNTVQDYMLIRAGLMDEKQYLNRLAEHIEQLERRPAHLAQSAEEASLDAWLEKYPTYASPERSISYYNKGELLGVILDLAMRDASHGTACLRDLLRWMNREYAQQGKFFPDSDGVLEAADAVSHANLKELFQKYVSGKTEIPWDEFFRTVGLRLMRSTSVSPDIEFEAARIFDAPPVVISVKTESDAQRAGLETGDSILQINGQIASADFQEKLSALRGGDTLRLRVRRASVERELQWKIGSREEIELELKDVDHVTRQQKLRRAAWINAEPEGAASR